MFGQKSAFGQSSSFGGLNSGASTSSPFGGSTFGKPAAPVTGFGAAPAFGSPSAGTSNTGGGLFGATSTPGTSLFGATSTPATGFGATPTASTGFGGFGQTTANTGLFGQSNTTSGGLFGQTQQQQTGFGAKPAGFGFGTTNTGGSTLFGQQTQPTTSLFGQSGTTLGSGGGLFGASAGGFGQQQQAGTGHVKYNPVCGTDVMTKNGQSQSINIKHQCITCMKEYESKSFEELRMEDYMAGRKGSATAGTAFGAAPQTNTFNTSFGTENKPAGGLFGNTGGFGVSTPAFGATNANTSSSLFGGSGAFGAKPATTSTGFGGFGTAQPSTGLGLFGSTTTQAAPAFGTTTSTFGGFGSTNQTQQSTSLFGAKPATTSTGFGGFGTTNTSGGLFGAKPNTAAPAFGSTAPAFGSTAPAFGATNANTSSSLFGGTGAFGAKPATTSTGFGGFGTAQPATGLGTGLNTSFNTKPLFPSFGTNTQQNTQLNTSFGGFGTGNTFGSTLGGGLGSSLGTSTLGQQQPTANWAAPAQNNVHEQIMALVARPYGDQPLFKDLPESGIKPDDLTNSTANQKLSADISGYMVSPPGALTRLKVKPLGSPNIRNKKSLFDGLEENDPTLECKLSLKPTRKRLILKNRTLSSQDSNNSFNGPIHRSTENLENEKPQSVKDLMGSTQDRYEDQSAQQKSFEQRASNMIESPRGINADLQDESKIGWLSKKGTKSSPGNLDSSGLDESLGPQRIYPSLDNVEIPERRSSWLTTKPLMKAMVAMPNQESSVADLKLHRSILDAEDKENIISVSEEEEQLEEPREYSPHPTGIKLNRPGYYTIPSLDDLIGYIREDGTCVVPTFTIGRKGYGNIYFDEEMDIANLDLDELVHILNKEVIVYPSDADRPPVGKGLNRRAIITLDRVWPRDKTLKQPITDPERLAALDYEGKLRRVCDKHSTKFIEYRPQTGSWVFRVEHFSKYGLTDSDEEEEAPRQGSEGVVATIPQVGNHVNLQQQALQKAGLPPQQLQQKFGLGGIMSEVTSLIPSSVPGLHSTTMQSTNDETNFDATSLYSEMRSGLKSPTNMLAKFDNRNNHQLQLMKASLYFNDMEEDRAESVSDQTVPVPRDASRLLVDNVSVKTNNIVYEGIDVNEFEMEEQVAEIESVYGEEISAKPLIVPAEMIILKTNGQVVPYKKTLAGKMGSSCPLEMLIARSRHSRAGFGPRSQLAYLSTKRIVSQLKKANDHTEIGSYVCGRDDTDTTGWVVNRLKIGGNCAANNSKLFVSYVEPHLLALLESSQWIEGDRHTCPKLVSPDDTFECLALLKKHVDIAKLLADDMLETSLSESMEYNKQVWMLCEALWAIDLQNGGTASNDITSILERSRAFSNWLKYALSSHTDYLMQSEPYCDEVDENDLHSSKVLALLLGGRVVEACALARKHGDYNMAVILALSGGDAVNRSLIERQIRVWESCGATSLISRDKMTTLRLLCGQASAAPQYWLSALAAHYWYICPQVSTIESAIKSFESTFVNKDDSLADDQVKLELVDETEYERLPQPSYYSACAVHGDKKRLIFDLRYQLIKGRATGSRTYVHPQSHTDDPMDYSLSFILGAWLGTLSPWAIVGIADQLEAANSWHLAIMALMYHPNDVARSHLVRAVLSRNVSARDEESDKLSFVSDKLKVPRVWILKARAERAKYERLWTLEAKYLAEANEWNSAHEVFMNKLLPSAVLTDKLEDLYSLLDDMNEAAEKDLVSGWLSGGAAPYNYIKVCQEIRRLVESRCCELDRLSTYVVKAAQALAQSKCVDAPHIAAKCEMGSRLVQLSLSRAGALGVGGGRANMAKLLDRLRLPPDYIQHALDVIVSGTAEEISEEASARI